MIRKSLLIMKKKNKTSATARPTKESFIAGLFLSFLMFACGEPVRPRILYWVAIAAPSDISVTSAKSFATITVNDGITIIERGVCWSNSALPTVSDSKTSDGSGEGSFASSITGLTGDTWWYVRAYATYDKGTF